jgi:hypothetical protein
MDHGLLVARLIIAQSGDLLERLPHARDIAVPEYTETSRKKLLLDAVAFDVLLGQKRNEGLCHRQSLC